jgi:uncharacterized protein (DUF433 family)
MTASMPSSPARGLETDRIVALYPGLDAAHVEDAIKLEERLWRAA